jgi:hypothetical protein
MFIGHYATAFAAKTLAPRASLGVLIAAATFIDLLWPVFLLAGLERVEIEPGITAFTPLDLLHYPYSHSLLAVAWWGVLFGLVYFAWMRYARGAWVVALLVIGHWLLDALVHRPDLPLYPGSELYVGAGLWNSIGGTLLVEGLLFAAAVWLYARATAPTTRVGRYGFWSLIALLVFLYLGSAFGPPPPSAQAIAVVGLAGGALGIAWTAWFDRRRQPRSP